MAVSGRVAQRCMRRIQCYWVGSSTAVIVVFLTAILGRLQEVRWYFLPHGSVLSSCAFSWHAPAITVAVYYRQLCKAVSEMFQREPLFLICCPSKITNICETGLWALIFLKTPVMQVLWAGYLWLPVLSCSNPSGHLCTWGIWEVLPLFTQAVSQREQSLRSLPALDCCMTALFPQFRIEMYFSCIPSDSSRETATKCRAYLWFYFHLSYTVLRIERL